MVGKVSANADAFISIPYVGRLPMKIVALTMLVVQTVAVIVVLRISRMNPSSSGFMYINTTAVVMSELFKLLLSFVLLCKDHSWSISAAAKQLNIVFIAQPWDTIKVGVPALLYTLQNNLIFIALSHLSPAIYQVTYQLKILTTALLSVILLGATLSVIRWTSLFILTTGVALIQLSSGTSTKAAESNFFVGTVAVIGACFTSGFAGVYFEKILKGSKLSIWLRNIQLAAYGILAGLLGVYMTDRHAVIENGFFQGYTFVTWLAIFLQGVGGLIVAVVLKYADNILKCFGNALAIVMSCLFSYFLLKDFNLTSFFFLGAFLVVVSTFIYGVDPNPLMYLPRFLLRYKGFTLLDGKSKNENFAPDVEVQRAEIKILSRVRRSDSKLDRPLAAAIHDNNVESIASTELSLHGEQRRTSN